MPWIFIQATKACMNLNPNSVIFFRYAEEEAVSRNHQQEILEVAERRRCPKQLRDQGDYEDAVLKFRNIDTAKILLQKVYTDRVPITLDLLWEYKEQQPKKKKVMQGTDAPIPSGVSETVFI